MAAVSIFVLAACGSDPDPGTDTTSPKVPDGLLSADTVGGKAIGNAKKYLGYSAGTSAGSAQDQCQLDTVSLLAGASDDVAMAYDTTQGTHPEVTGIGVLDITTNAFDSARASLQEGLASPGCQRPPAIEATNVDLGLESTTAISVTKNAGTDDEKSLLRSYTYLQIDGSDKLVLVSIERTDGSTPAVDELKKLTAAQIAKTTDDLAG